MNSNIKTAIFWVVLICLAVLLWTIVRQGKAHPEDQIAFTDFVDQIKDHKVREVNIAGQRSARQLYRNRQGIAHPHPH